MTNVETERKYFWDKYQEILMENGDPLCTYIATPTERFGTMHN